MDRTGDSSNAFDDAAGLSNNQQHADDSDFAEGTDTVTEAPSPKRHKSKHEAERERKETALSEVLMLMDDFVPIIPDAITDYHLARAGFQCEDVRIKRLLALATQKFISDIATDAIQHSKLRQQAAVARDRKAASKMDKRTVLSMDDLSSALAEHGVNVKKPDYYI